MTEIAVRPDADLDPTEFTAPPTDLAAWVTEARDAHWIAERLARTSFVPASLRDKPQDITAAILAGRELGLQPMATLRSIDVIQGTPALRAHAMRGLVQAAGHHIQLVESTETLCRMRGRRAGDETWQEVTWTLQRAERLGLTGKDQWKKQPQTMLVARATGEICRLVASDVLYAMPYAAEELGDRTMSVRAQVEAAAPARVTAAEIRGEPTPTEQAAPDLDEWPEVAQPPDAREVA